MPTLRTRSTASGRSTARRRTLGARDRSTRRERQVAGSEARVSLSFDDERNRHRKGVQHRIVVLELEPRCKLPNARVERLGEGIAVTFDSGILFAVNSAQLQPAGQQNLRDLAVSLEEYEGTEVLVVGHTDSTGTDSYNQTLSERRADSARTYLLGAGLEPGRVRAVGRGETEPIASNDTDAGRQDNRRVEVAIFASEEMQQRMLRDHGR